MIPKFSTPLSKAVRTTEGILLIASHLVLSLAALLPHGLSWTHAALFLTIQDAAAFIARSGVKIAAINHGLGFGPPIDPLDGKPVSSVVAPKDAT